MNLDTVYKSMNKVAGASGSWTPAPPKPYSRPSTFKPNDKAIDLTTAGPHAMQYDEQPMFNSVGSNLKNWFGQKAWDVGHTFDTLFGTKSTYGTKRPTDQSYGGSFWNAINPFGTRPQQQQNSGNPHNLPTWQKRMLEEQKGTLDTSKGRDAYNRQITLPDNKVFGQMAEREALGQQYDKLRQAGWSQEQISNYVMQEKYLPLVRQATGKQNITGSEQLTPQQMETIKNEMINRQMRGVANNLNKVDQKAGVSNKAFNDRSTQQQQAYQEALSQAYDARTQAMRNGEDPDKVKINYSDAIKKNKAMSDAVTRASQNSW